MLNISSSGAYLETTVRLRPLSLVYLQPDCAGSWEESGDRIAASVVRQDANGVGLEWSDAGAQTMSIVIRLGVPIPVTEERPPSHLQPVSGPGNEGVEHGH